MTDGLTRTENQKFFHYLMDSGVLDLGAGQRLQRLWEQSSQPLSTILLELGLLEENRLADCLAKFSGLERVALGETAEIIVDEERLPADFLRRARLLPLELTSESITFAVADPLDDTSLRAAGYLLGLKARAKVGLASEISQTLNTLYPTNLPPTDQQSGSEPSLEAVGQDLERLRDLATEAPVVRLLSGIVTKAVNADASDIHIEPMVDHVRVRYRIDGHLIATEPVPQNHQLALNSRIKILARLNIAEQRLPQDGRIRLAIKGREIDFRVSTSPTIYGESVVLRILDRKSSVLNFQSLGFDSDSEEALRRLLACSNGIILVTGPTGSGKTTTLYAGLEILNKPERKVFTVEDPIEYFLKGVNQILVRPQIGLDFASILRSVLRQDPDVIMVGEIRDRETATIAAQAALTGHLVLSSLHTNSAAASITRLRNLGLESYLIGATLRGIVSQRLVRKLCPHCKQPSRTSKQHRAFEPRGCTSCNQTGYSGRSVIYEILEVDEQVRSAIEQGRSDSEIEAACLSRGMISLRQSGLNKVRDGETCLEEIRRATDGVVSGSL